MSLASIAFLAVVSSPMSRLCHARALVLGKSPIVATLTFGRLGRAAASWLQEKGMSLFFGMSMGKQSSCKDRCDKDIGRWSGFLVGTEARRGAASLRA